MPHRIDPWTEPVPKRKYTPRRSRKTMRARLKELREERDERRKDDRRIEKADCKT